MTQLICDICGKIINGTYSHINFPSMYSGNIIQRYDEYDASDVCQKCALDYYDLTEKFRKDKRYGENND